MDGPGIHGQPPSQQIFQPGGVQHCAGAEDPVLRVAAQTHRRIGQHIHRIADDQQDRVPVHRGDFWHDIPEDADVFLRQIQPGLSGLLAGAGGDDDDGGIRKIGVIPRIDLHGTGEGQPVADVQSLALGPGAVQIQQDQLGKQTAVHQGKGRGRAHISASEDGGFSNVHGGSPFRRDQVPTGTQSVCPAAG